MQEIWNAPGFAVAYWRAATGDAPYRRAKLEMQNLEIVFEERIYLCRVCQSTGARSVSKCDAVHWE